MTSAPPLGAERPRTGRFAEASRRARRFFGTPVGHDALIGFVGSCLITLGGVGAGAVQIHDPMLETLHLSWLRYGHGEMLSGTVIWVGVLLMLFSWVRLGRALLRERMSLGEVRWLLPLWTAPLLLSAPVFSRDVYSYLAQGALLRDGFDPYKVGPAVDPGRLLDNVSTIWTTTTAPYGPAFMLLGRGVTTLTGDNVLAGTLLLRLTMLPGLALAIWAIPRLSRHLGGKPAIALWLALLNPLVLIHLIGGPHNEMLMVGLMIAAIVLVLDRRHVAGFAVLGLAVAIKATAGAALPFLVWIWILHERERAAERGEPAPNPVTLFVRVAATAAIAFAAVYAAVSAVAGLGLGWAGALFGANTKIINWLTVPTMLGHVATWFGASSLTSALSVTRIVCGAAMVAVLVYVVLRYRRTEREAVLGILLALTAILLLSPATLPWYYSWPLAIAAGFALSETTLAVLVGLSVWIMVIFQPDGSIGMYQWSHVVLTTFAAVLAAVSLRREDPLRLRALWGRMARADASATPTAEAAAPAPAPADE